MGRKKAPLPRRPVAVPTVIANWKMQLSIREATRLAQAIRDGARSLPAPVQIVLCPTFPALPSVRDVLRGSGIALGAQDAFWDERGPFTGAVSPSTLAEAGCQYVILGHSERRRFAHEDDEAVSKKVSAALRRHLTPILCVGETLDDRRAGHQERIVTEQVVRALAFSPPPATGQRLCIAYEPVWAIGTGQAIEPEQALTMAKVIHQALVDLFAHPGSEIGTRPRNVKILYGGSVDAENVVQFISGTITHGVLVGTASLDERRFLTLLHAVARNAAAT